MAKSDTILLALGGALVGYGLLRRRTGLVQGPTRPAASSGGLVGSIIDAAKKVVGGVTTTVTGGDTRLIDPKAAAHLSSGPAATPPPGGFWPLRSASDVTNDAREWLGSHDPTNLAAVVLLLRSYAGYALASGMKATYYWTWLLPVLAGTDSSGTPRTGKVPARTLALAQSQAATLGPIKVS